ncbi:hypothetical protein COO60DRAFT_1460037 [Scenedesmus sp. NREL 46B-D3]|nr:hypothetical protein COO60DRAFT_1460037 [Scenedesmus sp. NREL 46B-D3]
MKPHTPLLALAVALCLGSVLANDLQVAVKVYGCKGEGSATNKCKIEVVGGAGSATYATLGLLDSRRQLVSPRDWLCSEKKCCKPCAPNNAQEASCTQFIDYGLLEFRPTGGCPRSCCADECTARVRVNGRDTTATGTCSGHFDELRGSRRRSLLQAADDGTTSVTAEVLAELSACLQAQLGTAAQQPLLFLHNSRLLGPCTTLLSSAGFCLPGRLKMPGLQDAPTPEYPTRL